MCMRVDAGLSWLDVYSHGIIRSTYIYDRGISAGYVVIIDGLLYLYEGSDMKYRRGNEGVEVNALCTEARGAMVSV